jgi:uncharacterized membrane protein
MEVIMEGFKVVAETINIIGIMILIFGFSKELIKYLMAEFKGGIMLTPIKDIQKIRCQLGVYILLALDFLIASDIILSIVDLSMEELIKLSVTIVLRIAMGYFLGKEVDEAAQEEQENTK